MAFINYVTQIQFEFGAVQLLRQECDRVGITRPLIVTDPGVKAAGVLQKALDALPGLPLAVFDQTPANPTEAAVRAAVAVYQAQGCDGLIAVGGGSAIDCAKGIAIAATHEGPLTHYATIEGGSPRISERTAPVIAVPTTSGTGSEVARGAIPVSTIREIMADEATSLPAGFDFGRDMTRLAACKSLAEYLTPWQVLRLFPKKRANLDRLAHAVLASLAENAVRFVELRSSVLYLTGLQSCTPAQALERLIESTGSAAQHHGIRRGLILTVTRGDYGASNLATLLQAYEDLGRPKDVVGLDLAGDEEMPYPAELPAMIRKAKDRYGFGITIHAGETGRVENVRGGVAVGCVHNGDVGQIQPGLCGDCFQPRP